MAGANLKCEFDVDRLQLRMEATVTADPAAINPAVERTMTIVREMECAKGDEFEVETSLREALTNAIVHGCKLDPKKTVHISVHCDAARGILIVVRDPGSGFDPRTVPSPLVGENVYSSHGRGIFLITRLMDEVRFARGGTEIHMRKGGGEPVPEPADRDA
jgi:serine/threonine-protein kinase RsbW